MKKTRMIIIVILFFNALSALYGGGSLIFDPSGDFLQLPIRFLESTPFNDFLIPGIILFSVNGLFNLYVAILGIRKSDFFTLLTILCGLLLIIWLTVQIIIIKEFFAPAHLPYYIIGILLIFLGGKLKKQNSHQNLEMIM